jgi:hypothetical protein
VYAPDAAFVCRSSLNGLKGDGLAGQRPGAARNETFDGGLQSGIGHKVAGAPGRDERLYVIRDRAPRPINAGHVLRSNGALVVKVHYLIREGRIDILVPPSKVLLPVGLPHPDVYAAVLRLVAHVEWRIRGQRELDGDRVAEFFDADRAIILRGVDP